MNLKQLREEAWDIAREIAVIDSDRLWTTKEMNRYINRVYRHIARETRCIRDAETLSICRIASTVPTDLAELTSLAATDARYAQDLVWYNEPTSWLYQHLVAPYIYDLHPLIIDIDEVKWASTSRTWRLNKVSVNKWQVNPVWEQTIGMPTEYCTDYSNGRIAINFRADTSDTLKLTVRRMPLTDLVLDTDVPEYRTHYHDFMINGILWQMYSKQDSQTFDGEKAVAYQARFLADVDEIKQQETILDQRLKPNHSLDAFR